MAVVPIHGAEIYYQVYGENRAGRVPVLLIHGSTVCGEVDWGEIAPILSAEYQIYVPDCRGHGKSTNPPGTYSFKQMADDAAEFVKFMGYERMHIIGHSNGGNVALVMLMEHPGVVQSAILQAANAYVTDYLRQREPVVLQPDYYATNHPDDVVLMKQIHAELYGNEYWRDLLTMTMQEIITQPNYSATDLARVNQPVLAIMGSEDQVNAPDRHAQFIAENIPQAELWIPSGVGHNVHYEIPDEWIKRVLDFLWRQD